MKTILLVISLTFSLMIANARTFEIKVLNTPTINIGGKNLKVGNRFDENAVINWSSNNQAMKVLSDDNKIYVLSKGLLSKHNSKTFADYITSIKSATVRNDGENFPVTVADHRALLEGDFVLLDSINVKVGWRTNDSSYFEATTTNLGEKNISFIITSMDNVLTITRNVFSQLSSDCDYVILSINYIEKEYGETTPITDSMNIEIVPYNLINK